MIFDLICFTIRININVAYKKTRYNTLSSQLLNFNLLEITAAPRLLRNSIKHIKMLHCVHFILVTKIYLVQ